MKSIFIIVFLFLETFINLNGQWYVKEYNVTDLNLLSKEQLELSLAKSKRDLVTAVSISGMGGVTWVIFKYATLRIVGLVAGGGLFAGGAIASMVCLNRIVTISATIRRKNSSKVSISISPAIISDNYTRSYFSGITLTYKFQ